MTLAKLERLAYSLNNMKIVRDIVYFENQRLDVFIPEKIEATFIHFHGGGIVEGDKTDCDPLMNHLVKRNFLVFNVNYSLYPNTKFPKFIEEAAHAVRYVFDHINEFGGSKDSIYLSGQSAGAYIITMLAVNPAYLNKVNISPKEIKGYVSDSGQMSDHFHVQQFELGLDPWLQRISKFAPLYYINKENDIPPLLLIYYSNDMLNRKEQNIMLYNLVKFYHPEADIAKVELQGSHCEGSCKLNENGEYPYINELIKWRNRQ